MHADIPIYDIVKDYIKTLLIKKFKISNVKHSVEYSICKFVYYEWIEYGIGTHAAYIFKKVKKKITCKDKRKKFHNLLKKLANAGIINKEKIGKLLVLTVPPEHQTTLLNLIRHMQNSNSQFHLKLQRFMREIDPSPRMIRQRALLEFINTKQMSIEDRLKLEALFSYYLGAIDSKVIVLYNRSLDALLKIPYSTRFNDKGRIYEKIDQLYEIFENAAEKYVNRRGIGDAVFLTLTLDPKNFRNILDATKSSGGAINRFISFLRRRFRKKIDYVNVAEFQRNGMIHFHMVIFGFRWLISQKELSKIWKKYGMGEVVYIYRLRFSKKDEDFVFYKNKPKNTKTNSITDYLAKYLKKAFYDKSELALFWLTNKRFFTYSRSLLTKEEEKIPKIKVKRWEFIGVFDADIFEKYTDEEFKEIFVYSIRRYRRKIRYRAFFSPGGYTLVYAWGYV